MAILVTGGAGYIGSHVVDLLKQKEDEIIIVDDFSTGSRERTEGTTLYEFDLASEGATRKLTSLMKKHDVTGVIHIAAKKQVGESVEKPLMYYSQNLVGMINVLTAMQNNGIKSFVFSSSAATYGMPEVADITEDVVNAPINPYGETKLIGEWMANALVKSDGMRVANLRYFNVAGAASPELADPSALNLVPIVFNSLAQGKQPAIFGDDYDTPDGSCIRDYIHIVDLAQAHLDALEYISGTSPEYTTFNVGTGQGASVFEVMDMIKDVTNAPLKPVIMPRRAGDPPKLVANSRRIEKSLGWKAKHDLRDIIESTWEAHVKNVGPFPSEITE